MEPQEVFNTVSRHLFKQGHRAGVYLDAPSSPEFECRYHAPNGEACAVGCLMTDDVYDPEMEGSDVLGVVENFSVPEWMRQHTVLRLLRRLQLVHDDQSSWRNEIEMKGRLDEVAKQFGLSRDVLADLHFPEKRT